jgi:hypothetical protein
VQHTVDPDFWWHLPTGQLILEEGIPRHDPYSFTVAGRRWITHEWLSELVMWGVYRAGGLPGLMIVFALLIALTFLTVYRSIAGRPFVAALVVLLAAATSALVWGARPQIFNLLMTAVFVHVIERSRAGHFRAGILWVLPLLTVLWANLHSGYMIGVVLLATYTVGEGLQHLSDRRNDVGTSNPSVRQLGAATVACLLAAVLNPNGMALWIYPFETLRSPAMRAYIQEWQSPDFHRASFLPFGLMMALGVLGWLFSRRRPTTTELLLFFGAAAAGLMSARNIPIFAIISAPIVARHLLNSCTGLRIYPVLSGAAPSPPSRRVAAAVNVSLFGIALVLTALWTAVRLAENEEAIRGTYPVAAVDFLEREGLSEARGYNSYNWGGYLIWRQIPVFVDGRADVYGDDFLSYYRQAFSGGAEWSEPLDDFDVTWVLIERGSVLGSCSRPAPGGNRCIGTIWRRCTSVTIQQRSAETRWRAVVALVGLVLLGIAVQRLDVVSSALNSAPERVGRSDAAMFRSVVDRVAAGESYYPAMGRELRTGHYPTASVFNWRMPTLYLALAVLPGWFSASLMAASCLVLLGAVTVRLARHGSPEGTVLGLLLSAAAAVTLVDSQGYWMTEAWGGLLIGLSLAAYLWSAWIPAALLALGALFVRELAAPYCMVCLILALRAQRRREVKIWIGGLAVFAMYYALHAANVLEQIRPDDLAQQSAWVQFGGLSFWLATVKTNKALLMAPQWILTGVSVLLAAALWAPALSSHVRWSLLAYVVFFAVAGQWFNDYWGFVAAFVYALAFAHGPDGLLRLISEIRSRPARARIA